jgi:hypothetical protein
MTEDDKKGKKDNKVKKEEEKVPDPEANPELKQNTTVRSWKVNIQEIRVTNLMSEKQSLFLVFKIGDSFKLVDSFTTTGKLVGTTDRGRGGRGQARDDLRERDAGEHRARPVAHHDHEREARVQGLLQRRAQGRPGHLRLEVQHLDDQHLHGRGPGTPPQDHNREPVPQRRDPGEARGQQEE